MTAPTLTAALAELDTAAAGHRDAVKVCERWAVAKSIRKTEAIARLMQGTNPLTGKPHSASSAEAIAEGDAEYARFLAIGTAATLRRMEAEIRYDVARYRCEALSRGLTS